MRASARESGNVSIRSSMFARAVRFSIKIFCTSLVLTAAAVVLAWMVGRACTDRFHWSQWLWWIPTPLTLAIIIIGFAATAGMAGTIKTRKSLAIASIILAAAIATYFCLIEHKMLRRAPNLPPTDSFIKVVHWNAQPPRWLDVAPTIDIMRQTQADLIVLTDPGGPLNHERADDLRQDGYTLVSAHPFAVASRLPIITLRTCIMVDRMSVTLLEIDATDRLGRKLTVYLVDLPSNTGVARMPMAKRLRAMLDKLSLPDPDLVIGDFNIPRGSASIATLFPLMPHAFDEAGHGYGATYSRTFPLWHIDHILVSSSVYVGRYDIDDPGLSRHRMQTAWIAGPR